MEEKKELTMEEKIKLMIETAICNPDLMRQLGEIMAKDVWERGVLKNERKK